MDKTKKVKANTVTYKLNNGKARIYLTIPEGFIPPPEIDLYQRPNTYKYIYEK